MCDCCSYKTSKIYNRQRHKWTHTDEKLECNECRKIFWGKYDLQMHIKVESVTFKWSWICLLNLWKIVWKSWQTLQPQHHGTWNGMLHICELCEDKYKSRQHLQCHITKYHNLYLYKCQKYGKNIQHKSSLARYVASCVSGSDTSKTVHICSNCG